VKPICHREADPGSERVFANPAAGEQNVYTNKPETVQALPNGPGLILPMAQFYAQ
jgi:hypothetical protein